MTQHIRKNNNMGKLSEFDITYQPRTAMKAQVLADFITECTWADKEI